jgi:predicted dienelactone hydrolase
MCFGTRATASSGQPLARAAIGKNKPREVDVMRSVVSVFLALVLASPASSAQAAVGLTEIPGMAGDGPVTVFYPSSGEAEALRRGPFTLQVAPQGPVERGNGRLVVISHGSGGSPWPQSDLARELVNAGFIVALPQHKGDNHRDDRHPGPDSWTMRPAEVSRAIDAVAADARFAPLLALDRVGMYGMSAGGHTALSLAGGRWSPAAFAKHCDAHLAEEFHACVGLTTRLTGGWADGIKLVAAHLVIRWRFDDATPRAHHDPRIAAVVAGVPAAADFDMASLVTPRVPLGLITARQDRWLAPRFHSDRVLAACLPRCQLLADLPRGGHGALLSPLVPGLDGLIGDLLNDPPGFDRAAVVPDVNRAISAFFRRHLLP